MRTGRRAPARQRWVKCFLVSFPCLSWHCVSSFSFRTSPPWGSCHGRNHHFATFGGSAGDILRAFAVRVCPHRRRRPGDPCCSWRSGDSTCWSARTRRATCRARRRARGGMSGAHAQGVSPRGVRDTTGDPVSQGQASSTFRRPDDAAATGRDGPGARAVRHEGGQSCDTPGGDER